MERLVVDLEKITFQENFQNELTENCTYTTLPIDNAQLLKFTIKNCLPNMNIYCDDQMPEKRTTPLFALNMEETDVGDSILNSTDDTSSDDNFDDRKEHKDESDSNETGHQVCSGIQRRLRILPQRARKLNSEGEPNLRIPMKPAKSKSTSTDKLSPAQIRKLYSNQKLTSFRPTKLETIFEEPQAVRARVPNSSLDGDSQFRLIGSTKIKRSLIICDGFNINKTLVKQRRAKVKKNFGHRHAWKKMPLEGFIERLKNNRNTGIEENSNECEEKMGD